MAEQIDTTLDDVFRSTPLGTVDSSIGETFYGINQRNQPSSVPINKDTHGLTFFVRPQLNLSDFNLRPERKFIPLMTQEPASIQRIIRCLLDPRLSYENKNFGSPFVDQQNAFIPILTNHLESCTGWPDSIVNTFLSKEGVYKEQYGFVDGIIDEFSSYELTCSFRNMSGNPLIALFAVWQRYMTNVFQGVMSPYPDFIMQNELDFNTRIYRVVLDKNKRFVQHIGSTGYCFPTSVPNGSVFNYESGTPFNLSNAQIPINFRCFGFCYNDDILIDEFNKSVGIFNVNMRDEYVTSNMVKIPHAVVDTFKNRGYPRINPKTYELEWYVDPSDYERIVGAYARHFKALKPTPDPESDRTLDYSINNDKKSIEFPDPEIPSSGEILGNSTIIRA